MQTKRKEFYSNSIFIGILSVILLLATSFSSASRAEDFPKKPEPSLNRTYSGPTLLEKIGLKATRPLNTSELSRLKIKEGLLVQSAEGISGIAGVRSDDILISINGRDTRFGSITNLPDDFPTTIVLLIIRANERIPVAVQLPPTNRPHFKR
jgi:hypothetical protein